MTPDLESNNAYEVLGLDDSADAAAITLAFRTLIFKHHPDVAAETDRAQACRRTTRIVRAYLVLKDPEKRQKYDAMLRQRRLPDLTQGAGELPGLAKLAGGIPSFGIQADEARLLGGMDATLRSLLLSRLVRTSGFSEPILDAFHFDRVCASSKIEMPRGAWSFFGGIQTDEEMRQTFTRHMEETHHLGSAARQTLEDTASLSLLEGWIVVTGLQVIVLLQIGQEYVAGEKLVENTYHQVHAFPFASMRPMVLRRIGRANSSYELQLTNDDSASITVGMELARPPVAPLLLAASCFRVPLRARALGKAGREYSHTFKMAILPPILWGVGWLIAFLCYGFREPGSAANAYQWMTSHWLTTASVYLPPLILAVGLTKVHKAWSTGRSRDVFGKLPIDFATGVRAATPGVPDA